MERVSNAYTVFSNAVYYIIFGLHYLGGWSRHSSAVNVSHSRSRYRKILRSGIIFIRLAAIPCNNNKYITYYYIYMHIYSPDDLLSALVPFLTLCNE